MINKDKIKNILLNIRYHNKCLIEYYTYNELCKSKNIDIMRNIRNSKIKYLKYIKRNANITFYYDDYNNVFKCVNYLLNNNFTNIVIYVNNKTKFNDYILYNNIDNIINNNVIIKNLINKCNIKII